MPARSILLVVSLPALAACSSGSGNPGPTGGGTTIKITQDMPPLLVAFRDVDSTWQPATMKTATSFEAQVHGPYLVTVVCEQVSQFGGTLPTLTFQHARTLDDPHELTGDCVVAQTDHAVTGHMVQAGFVQLGPSSDASQTAGWDFSLDAVNGSYDLIATSADRIAIRRAVNVGGDLAITPPVDVMADGMPLVDVVFTVANAMPGEMVSVSVGLLNATNPDIPAHIYLGAIDTAKAAPDAALVATDTQSVSLRAKNGDAMRALRRPFRVGGDTAFTLPPPVGDLTWGVNNGKLLASWTTLPAFDHLIAFVSGGSSNTASASLDADATPSFLAATGITQLDIDTDIPGFKPAWTVDFTRGYQRGLFVQKGTETGVLTSSDVSELVNGGPGHAGAAPRVRAY